MFVPSVLTRARSAGGSLDALTYGRSVPALVVGVSSLALNAPREGRESSADDVARIDSSASRCADGATRRRRVKCAVSPLQVLDA
jgi:hypothetical protein